MLSANDVKYFASLKQKKYRNQHGQFLIEGFHLVEECLKSNYLLEYIILRNDIDLSSHPEILKKISKTKTKVDALPANSFNRLIETESSQGIVGVVSKPLKEAGDAERSLIIALDKINDPGNLGTIIRTAFWFNVKEIFLSENSADVFNSKVIRSSQGGVFHINIHEDINLPSRLADLNKAGYNVLLFTPDAKNTLEGIAQSITNNDKVVMVFGSESQGISMELLNNNFQNVKIKGYSDCESLNVAISCGIALYEMSRIYR